jgi:hypothetical protein
VFYCVYIDFDFKPTNTEIITKLVNKINIKKATVIDQISCKLLKAGSPVLNKHLTTLLNNTIKHSQFPNRLKEAQVVPLHKKLSFRQKKKLSSCQYSANNFKNL